MPQEEIKISIHVRCPYCDSDDVDYSYPEQIRLTGDGFEVDEYSVLLSSTCDRLKAERSQNKDPFLVGLCESCHKVFEIRLYCPDEANFRSPDIERRESQMLSQFRHLKFGFDGEIVLSPSGIPMALTLGDDVLQFSAVIPLWNPFREHKDDVLYYGPPYGKYDIRINEGRMQLWIDLRYTLEETGLRKEKKEFVGIITELNGFLERHLLRYKVADIKKEIPVRFPPERILQAAYHTVFQNETLIRNKIWAILREKYGVDGGKWYKSILGPDLTERIAGRAKKAGDKHFKNSRFQEYLTLGECAELIEKRWQKDFLGAFEREEYLLRDLKLLEDYRNSIAHFRHIDFDAYDDLTLTTARLRKIFQ